ncbi:hypothetical protein CYMTET_32564 [Cymbomonas tetramitiformis]|uniref:UDP-3-O-acylglucosamine N-acyltransferase n=1 Tax=Cymbomonas tetramitiformis TaxID=36881 RepID=A0AAE0FFF9_9CHLO|nr:hypothetical protein CYMTET_32564 [Cymbomonas tetramitiformis]
MYPVFFRVARSSKALLSSGSSAIGPRALHSQNHAPASSGCGQTPIKSEIHAVHLPRVRARFHFSRGFQKLSPTRFSYKRCRTTAAAEASSGGSTGSRGDEGATAAREDLNEYLPWPNGAGLVHSTAELASDVVVEPGAVVHQDVKIAEGCLISSGCVIGPGVIIAAHTKLSYNVSLSNCVLGARCLLHHGVCVGQDGFGFYVDEKTGAVVKKPQTLQVLIGDDVEIGANSCVDRGSWRDTVIGAGTKIDNLVQVGHNVVVGNNCFLCGHVALGGSSTLGDYVVMGGKSAVADHISVCSMARVAAKSGVTHPITEKGDYGGFPAVPATLWRRQVVELRRLAKQKRNVESKGMLGRESDDE